MSSDTPTTDDRTATDAGATTSGGAVADTARAAATNGTEGVGEETEAGRPDRSVGVTMVSTPGDGSCGIGTYARDLLAAFDGGPTETIPIDQDAQSVRHFAALAVKAAFAPGDVVHVQHEYGLFRRDGSRYPGVLGVVFFPLLFALARLRRKRVVVTMHSVLRPDPGEAPFRVRLYLLLTHKLLASGADHLIFLADECEQRFGEDVALEPGAHSRLPHGVNLANATDVPRAEAKRRFGFDPEDTVVGIPGYVRPPKGHDIFVDVARELPEYEFLVAGGARPKGADFEFAESIAADAPENVTITGVLDDDAFPVALAAPDLALLPYRVVTQSGTFNWCAAQELPVLASDEPYFRRLGERWDVLETTPIDDPAVVAARVRDLIDDEARRGTLARNLRRYKARHSFQQVAGDHYRIYRHALDDTPVLESVSDVSSNGSARSTRGACSAQRERIAANGGAASTASDT